MWLVTRAIFSQVTRSPAVNGFERATIKLSVNRNPIIGDKFASRHGQKGIMSQLWPAADMPFSESGMTPDILFNPHGFPSRMTIGMLVESMAGKSAALHGVAHDATPFTFSDEAPASAYFGEQLVKAGYNFYGHEKFYSGITGEEFECDIFMGVIYYQRLRYGCAEVIVSCAFDRRHLYTCGVACMCVCQAVSVCLSVRLSVCLSVCRVMRERSNYQTVCFCACMCV